MVGNKCGCMQPSQWPGWWAPSRGGLLQHWPAGLEGPQRGGEATPLQQHGSVLNGGGEKVGPRSAGGEHPHEEPP